MRKIILASSSPRRKQLLKQLIGDNFEIKTGDYTEDNNLPMKPNALVMHHALEKGRCVARNLKEGVVISADSLVFFKNKALGKPYTKEKAKEMLNLINGKWVDNYAGLAVIDVENKKELSDYELTKIKMKKMSLEEIEKYIKSGEPLDRAGAFAVQEKGAIFIDKVKGDYLGAVGLPLFKLNKLLEQLGISIFEFK
ncbi:MAG: Maf family nucleotide pyrophosphatase [Nanoarchaeota archaeon]